MYDETELNEDVESALIDLRYFESELEKIAVPFQGLNDIDQDAELLLVESRERTNQLLRRLARLLQERGEDSATAYSMMTINNELDAQVRWMRSYVGELKKTIAERLPSPGAMALSLKDTLGIVAHKLKKHLMPILKKLSAKLWQIISKMLTPKEWKISGTVGTGLLGLASVGLEITFEP